MSNTCSTTHVAVSYAMLKKIHELILEQEIKLHDQIFNEAILKYTKQYSVLNNRWYRKLFGIKVKIPVTIDDLKEIKITWCGLETSAYHNDVQMGLWYAIEKPKTLVERLLNCIKEDESVTISFDDLGYIEFFFKKMKSQ